MKTLLTIILIVLVVATAGLSLFTIVEKDYRLYKLESACAMKQVANGVARRDVKGCGKADYRR